MPSNSNVALLFGSLAAVVAGSGDAPLKRALAAEGPEVRRCSRFASPEGSDSRRGTKNRPFRTAQRLIDSLRPGQTGCLRSGTYSATDEFVVRFDHGGRPGARITLRSYPGERATLLGNVSVTNDSDYVTLSRLRIEGTGGSNTVKIYAAHAVVESSVITNAWRGRSCMILGSDSYGVAVGPIVRRNRFRECGSRFNGNQDHAVYAQSVVDGTIIGNVFWNSAAYAIVLYPNAQRTRVAYNVVDGSAPSVRGGVLFGGESSQASSDNVVERNVIAYAETYNIAATWDDTIGTGNVAARNCLWGGKEGNVDRSEGGFRTHGNVVANPAFQNRERRNYRLRAASLCRRVIGSAGQRLWSP
jgi:Right handed beta helix region